MLVDILSTNNYVSFNIKIAERLGLHSAIYISELTNINSKAINKDKMDKEGFFKIDRKYLTSRTTLQNSEQRDIESCLCDLGVLRHRGDDVDVIALDIKRLTEIMMASNEGVLRTVEKIAAPVTKPKILNSRQSKARSLKDSIECDVATIRSALESWVDSVCENPNGGFLTADQIKIFQKDVEYYAQGDIDLTVRLIEVATTMGSRYAVYVIKKFKEEYEDSYRKQHRVSGRVYTKKVKVTDEVF